MHGDKKWGKLKITLNKEGSKGPQKAKHIHASLFNDTATGDPKIKNMQWMRWGWNMNDVRNDSDWQD
jgi:hypothetical protein